MRLPPHLTVVAAAGVLLVAGACSGQRPTLGERAETTTVEDPSGGQIPDEPGGDDDASTLPAFDPEVPARALVTATGVVVPVTSVEDDHYEILTPCGLPMSMVWGTPIVEATVVLDPGHGGEVETGAVGFNGLTEKELNLQIARRTARELTSRGISTVLTRTADYRIPLSSRAEIANRLESDLMVSIHHNAPNWLASDTPGTEVFVQSDSAESNRLGGLVWESVFEALDENFGDIEWVTNDDAGALRVVNAEGEDSYGMVRRPEMPAVLAELGYLSNPAEAELFATDEYVEVASVALADAIERWLTTDDPGAGFVEEARRFSPDGGTGGAAGCVDPLLE